MRCKDLIPFCNLLLCLSDCDLCIDKLFSFVWSHFVIGLSACTISAISVLLRKSFPVSVSSLLYPSVSSVRFQVYGLMSRSLGL